MSASKQEKNAPDSRNHHHANPPGDPVAKGPATDREKARQQQFAAEGEQKASQTANVAKQNVPIKQPNKATNNS